MDETIKIFISSRQNELENERTWAKEAVEETGKDLGKHFEAILVEEKPAPPSTTINEQCSEKLKECKAVICIYHRSIQEIVKNEFRWANERGIPIFVFKKQPQRKDEADDELKSFIESEVRPSSGEPEGPYGIYIYKPFDGRDIKDEIKTSLKEYYPTWFNFEPIPEGYLPSKVWPGKLEITRKVYVKPRCYSMSEEILKSKRLLIITGPAHIGKTSMGFHLADYFRKNNISRRFLVYTGGRDIYEIANYPYSIILLDDLFGGSMYRQNLIGDISKIILETTRKNHIIITSRKEVLNEARKSTKFGEMNSEDYTIEIGPEDYSDKDFETILEKHLEYFETGQEARAIVNTHEKEILRELRFPHNYECFVEKELKKVVKGEKNFKKALKDAKEIEMAVGQWFEGWHSKDKEVFYFLLTLTFYGNVEEEDFIPIYQKAIEKLNYERRLGLPLPGDIARVRKASASYVSQSGPLKLEHPSYREGIISRIIDCYLYDAIIILNIMAEDGLASVRGSVISILTPSVVFTPLGEVRTSTVDFLEEMEKKYFSEVIQLLKRLGRDEEAYIRSGVALVLREVGKRHPDESLPILEELTCDKDPGVRSLTVWALGWIGEEHPNEVLTILERLARNIAPFLHHGFQWALSKIGKRHPKDTLPVLERLLVSSINKEACGAGSQDYDGVLSRTQATIAIALSLVGEAHPMEALPTLERLAMNENEGVRFSIPLVMGEVGKKHPKEVLPILRKLAEDESNLVRFRAEEVLKNLSLS